MSSRKLRNPDDGELYDVPESDAEAALAAGYTAGDKLVNPDDGEEYEVPHGDVEAARAAGYAPRAAEAAPLMAGVPVPDDVAAAGGELADGVKAEAPGWGDALLTGAQGLTRYMGGDLIREGANRLETKIQSAFGHTPETAPVDLFQERSEVLANKEAHPTAAVVGEAAGLIGSAFVPASGVAKLLPGAGINAAGAAVAAKVAAKLAPAGTGLFRAAVGKVASIAAQGATETVLQGAAQEVNDAFLRGDYSKLAQKLPARVMNDIGEGAAWSLGTAGVLGVAKKGFQAVKGLAGGARKVGDFVGDVGTNAAVRGEQRAAGDVADALDEQAEQAVQHRAALEAENAAVDSQTAIVRTAEEVERAAAERSAQLARRADDRALTLVEKAAGARQHADAVVEGTKSIRSANDELLAIDDYFDEFAGKGAKQAENARDPVLSEWGAPVADPEFTGAVSSIGDDARRMLDDHGAAAYAASGGSAQLKRVATTADAFKASIEKSMKSGNVAEAYNLADDFKGLLGRLHNSKENAVRQFAEAHYPTMLNMLEDVEKFGPLAERQRPFNAALTAEIKAQQGFGVNGLIEDSGRSSAVNKWRNAEITNDKAVRSLLGEAGTGVAAQEDAYRNWLAAKETGFAARAQALGKPELIKKAARARELTRSIADTLDNVTSLRRGKDEFEAAKAAAELTPHVQFAGFSIDGKAALKLADMTAVAKLETRRAALASGRLARENTAQAIAEKLRKAQQQVNVAAERGKLWRAFGDAGKGVSAFSGYVETGAAAAAKATDAAGDFVKRRHVVKLITELDNQSDPESEESRKRAAQLERLAETVGPEMADAYDKQTQARNAFLLERLGPPPPASAFHGAPEREVDDDTVLRMDRYREATDDPTEAVKRISDGEGTPEDREVLEELHPDLWTEFRQKAVQTLSSSKRNLDFEHQLAISDALGLPLAAELSDDNVAFWAQFSSGTITAREEQREAEQSVKGGSKIKLNADSFKGKGDRLG